MHEEISIRDWSSGREDLGASLICSQSVSMMLISTPTACMNSKNAQQIPSHETLSPPAL